MCIYVKYISLLGGLLYTYLEKMQFNTHGIIEGLPDPPEDIKAG